MCFCGRLRRTRAIVLPSEVHAPPAAWAILWLARSWPEIGRIRRTLFSGGLHRRPVCQWVKRKPQIRIDRSGSRWPGVAARTVAYAAKRRNRHKVFDRDTLGFSKQWNQYQEC